jgi:hypothetical protein
LWSIWKLLRWGGMRPSPTQSGTRSYGSVKAVVGFFFWGMVEFGGSFLGDNLFIGGGIHLAGGMV